MIYIVKLFCENNNRLSFVDIYEQNRERFQYDEIDKIRFMEFAKDNSMTIASCAENIDLKAYGIEHNACIDKKLIESIIGCRLNIEKDKNQWEECGCMESIEVGTYNTCKNGCKYCYAIIVRKV